MQSKINRQIHELANKDPRNFLDSNVAHVSFDLKFNLVSANKKFLGVTNLDQNDGEEINFFQDLCTEVPQYLIDEISYLLNERKPWSGNFIFPNDIGKPSWYHTNIIPARDERENLIGFNLLATLEKSERSLISESGSTESWMKAIFNDLEEANLLLGLQANVLEYNITASKIIHWITQKELKLNQFLPDCFEKTFSNTFKALFEKAKNGQRQKFSRSFRNVRGKEKIIELELKPVADPLGEIMGVILNAIDITEEVHLEKRIRLSEKKLDDIAFINSHEVRAPLASILGLLHLLEIESYNQGRKKILSHLKKSAYSLEKVIHKVSENTYLPDANSSKSA